MSQLYLYIAQFVIPVAAITWIAIAPLRSIVGFAVQASATAIGLFALAKAGIWLFPPWWTPWLLAVLLGAAIVLQGRRLRGCSRWPTGWTERIFLVGFAALGLFCANETRLTFGSARPPAAGAVALSWPLGLGHYLVANGGVTTALNAHADALDQSVPAHREWHGTGYGVDLVAIDKWGLRADGVMPRDPRRYRIFGTPVVAPCAGEAIAAVDGLLDQDVPDADLINMAGNHVILRCGGIDIVLAHFQQGSLRVRAGQRLATGAHLAMVGNSGASSEPHLHIHAQAPGTVVAPLSGAPVPMTFEGRFLVRNDRR